MRTLIAAARVWRLPGLLGAGTVLAATTRWLPAPFEVPGRTGGVEWVLTPVLPSILAVAGWASFGVAHREAERITARPVHRRRASIVVLTLSIGVVAIGIGTGRGGAAQVAVRNLVLLVGLAEGAVVVTSGRVGWAVVLVPGAICWLLGAPAPGATPPGWAVLLHPPGSPAALAVALAAFALGSAGYLGTEVPRRARRPQRTYRGRRRSVGSEVVG